MVGQSRLAERLGQLRRHLLGSGPRARVDDRGQRVLAAQALGDQRALLVRSRARHSERDVRAVEAGGHLERVAQAEAARDVGRHARRGRGGGGHERARAERPRRVGEAEVVGPEVVSPLGDAVGLVDHEQPDAGRSHPLHESPCREALGRHVEEAQVPGDRPLERSGVRARVLLGVDQRNLVAQAARLKRLHLVLHERHERRHHHRQVVAQERGQLVAERLARPGGHDHEHVAPLQRRLARLALAATEVAEPEELVQRCGQIHGGEPP